jgi:MoxR-like ATPase
MTPMCGIVGYVGPDEALPIVLEGLRRLEYRGYDSAGVAILDGGMQVVKKWLAYGASVRAPQHLILGGKARALMRGRYHVGFEDVRALAKPVFRHRILRNFHAESERITTDYIVDRLLEAVPVPKSGL